MQEYSEECCAGQQLSIAERFDQEFEEILGIIDSAEELTNDLHNRLDSFLSPQQNPQGRSGELTKESQEPQDIWAKMGKIRRYLYSHIESLRDIKERTYYNG